MPDWFHELSEPPNPNNDKAKQEGRRDALNRHGRKLQRRPEVSTEGKEPSYLSLWAEEPKGLDGFLGDFNAYFDEDESEQARESEPSDADEPSFVADSFANEPSDANEPSSANEPPFANEPSFDNEPSIANEPSDVNEPSDANEDDVMDIENFNNWVPDDDDGSLYIPGSEDEDDDDDSPYTDEGEDEGEDEDEVEDEVEDEDEAEADIVEGEGGNDDASDDNAQEESASSGAEQEWPIKRIVNHKETGRGREYLVMWDVVESRRNGPRPCDVTWEPRSRLIEDGCGDFIEQYHEEFD